MQLASNSSQIQLTKRSANLDPNHIQTVIGDGVDEGI
jgi:hypothetical protein